MGAFAKLSIAFVAIFGVLFQLYLKDEIVNLFAIGRTIQPISDFPYTCRRIENSRLQACEDMWLSEQTRQLFMACSEPLGRAAWLPAVMELDWEKRSLNDAVIVADIDKPHGDFFVTRVLSTQGYEGISGDNKRMYLHGIDGLDGQSEDGKPKISIALINHRASVDAVTGKVLDASAVGGNSTVEIFETGPDATELRHVQTYAQPNITVPNRATFAGDDVDAGIYVTNESKAKVGFVANLMAILSIGNVQFCDATGCEEISSRIRFPNGLYRARDGLLYVPSSGSSNIRVYRHAPGASNNEGRRHPVEEVGIINIGYSIDNISEDADGNLFVAAFPKITEILKFGDDPMNKWSTATIFRIRKTQEADGKLSFTFEKLIEDRDKEVLPGATTAVRDAKTGRLFLGGKFVAAD
ncbi:hypothetical protein MCOR27_006207 [Pyricularia oryzae]|nr:hypothetical protein MCOR27_006207 [Pyricularia oryzae]KAI6324762.1 hypothetical protein MCOR29_003929 [Pyricularia oryzae]KAI6634909.1 hypothetical protein MCOR14_005984 [Pyricularia oryzae]KAI6637733.1 hypothetical protein MCOR08_002978 [Pyricularia oryzae]